MAHDRRKKGGERKDKKLQRMREAVEVRKENAGPAKPSNDQKDIVTFKSGSQNDRTVDPSAYRGGRGPTR